MNSTVGGCMRGKMAATAVNTKSSMHTFAYPVLSGIDSSAAKGTLLRQQRNAAAFPAGLIESNCPCHWHNVDNAMRPMYASQACGDMTG
jgi:hypothetical protein